jgi:hypothetical protein
MRLPTLVILMCLSSIWLAAQSRPQYRPTQHNIGYTVPLYGSATTDTTLGLAVRYRTLTSASSLPAPPPVRCVVRGVDQFRGSLLMLEPATNYEVTAMFTSATGRFAPFVDTITTRAEPLIHSNASIKVVSPTGSGTSYTDAEPGDLTALVKTGLACGTTVMLKGGIYSVANMTLTLPDACDDTSQIVFMAWPGDSVMFDGGQTITSTWSPVQGIPGMFATKLDPRAEFTSLCSFDGQRLYPYALRSSIPQLPDYPSLQNLGYDVSGFYRVGNTLYVKALDGTDPTGHAVRVSTAFRCMTIVGNSNSTSVVFSGIHVQDYGAHICTQNEIGLILECYPSFTFRFENVNNAIIDRCTFTNSNAPISFVGACNNNTVRNCTIKDGTGYWSHGAFKQTRDASLLDRGSYGRYVELSGISFAPADDDSICGNNVHHNNVNGVVGGITAGWITARTVVSDHDVYNNVVTNCYDGIDCTGGAGGGTVNARIWNNQILDCPVGTSLISNAYQATYIMRNVYRMTDRVNHNYDVFFMNCDNSLATSIWSTALKLNAGDTTRGTGTIHFVHNTVVSKGQFGFGLYLWNPTWTSLFMRNNIFASTNAVPLMFDGIAQQRLYSFDGDGDVYYAEGQSSIATIRPVHGVAGCQTVASPEALQSSLSSTTQSPLIAIGAQSIRRDPAFVNATDGNYHLQSSSGIIDAGTVVDGFTTSYTGAAPDPGAYEYDATTFVDETATPHSSEFNDHAIVRSQYFSLLGEELDAQAVRSSVLCFVRETDAFGNTRTRPVMMQR